MSPRRKVRGVRRMSVSCIYLALNLRPQVQLTMNYPNTWMKLTAFLWTKRHSHWTYLLLYEHRFFASNICFISIFVYCNAKCDSMSGVTKMDYWRNNHMIKVFSTCKSDMKLWENVKTMFIIPQVAYVAQRQLLPDYFQIITKKGNINRKA